MSSIKYTGTFTDHSGYGSANRAFITSLYISGVDITTEHVVQVMETAEHGWTGALCRSLIDRKIPYKIKIIHLTPDMYPRYMETGKYNIGHLFWETDRLPIDWIAPINQMQEIWASSKAMADLFRSSGVTVPISAFPQPIDVSEADQPWEKYEIPEHQGFLFYSIFQWIERKNPKALLQAYWETFTGRNDVSLLLKTYRVNYSAEEFEKIQLEIERWKRELHLVHFPRVLLSTKLLTHDELMRLHYTADAYVTADHGEGWCRPLQEALLMGKPAITTARGGIHEYLNPNVYYPIASEYVPVVQQPWIPWYSGEQKWAQINKEELKKFMKFAFMNKDTAKLKGLMAKDLIKAQFSYHKIGRAMKARLDKIEKAL